MKRLFLMVTLSLVPLLFTACTKTQLAAVNLMALGFDGERISNIEYAQGERHQLDIYRPTADEGSTQRPVVVFFHGGSWRDGNKDSYRFVGATLASRGYVVVIPNYRTFPQAIFPTFVEDTAAALAWAYQHSPEYGGNADQIIVMGHSSGAHMGALALTDKRYLAQFGLVPSQFLGFVGLSGPYAFTPREPDIRDVFAGIDDYTQMQVDTFIEGDEPPMLLLLGRQDRVVGRSNGERVRDAAERAGGSVDLAYYEGIDHAGMVAQFAAIYQADSPVLARIDRFVQQLIGAQL